MGKRILVAEDNPANRELLCDRLKAWGYEVIVARDGKEALAKIRETDPDMALLDIRMPGLDGLALIRELREDARFTTLPVVAVTAYAMRGDKEKILQAGFDGYITKPIDRAVLRKSVERFLG